MQSLGHDVPRWTLGPAQPYRLNLHYEPQKAVVRVLGEVTDACVRDLERMLDLLSGLPAPVRVDVDGASYGEVAPVLWRHRIWHARRPQVVVRRPVRRVTAA